ncbi:MAG: hypothetical protein ACOZNI_21255 [Myxococcota bacterium]
MRDAPWTGALLVEWAPFGAGETGFALAAGPELASLRYEAVEGEYTCCSDVDETPFLAVGLATRVAVRAHVRRVGVRAWVGDRLLRLEEPTLYASDPGGPRIVSEWRGGLDVVVRIR